MNKVIEFCHDAKKYNRGTDMLNGGEKLACVGIVLTVIGVAIAIKGKHTIYDTMDPKIILTNSEDLWENLYAELHGDV